MRLIFVTSIVSELLLASLIFCRHAGKPRLKMIWLLFAAYAVIYAAHSLLFGEATSEFLFSTLFYGLAFVCDVVIVKELFGLPTVSALVVSALGYCAQHLGSDISFMLLPSYTTITESVFFGYYATHFLVMLATWVVIYLLVGRNFRIDIDVVERRMKWVVLSIAVVLFVIMFSMIFANDQTGTTRLICFAYDAISTGAIMCVLILVSSVDSLRSQMAANEAIWENKSKQYELARESVDTINLKCHDIRKRVQQMQGPTLSKDSVAEIQDNIKIYDAYAHTGNDAIDVVLTSKNLLCSRYGIEFSSMVDSSALEFMPDDELYFLMENILDNAIEAETQIDDTAKRAISLTVRREGNFATIREDNYFVGKLEFVDGLPETSKQDKTNHGFGMKSIRRCVDNHGGEMLIRADDSIFSLSIVIPIP